MRIAAVHAFPLSYPLDRPYGMARGLTSARGTTLLALESDNGKVGYGEAWGPGPVAKALIEFYAPSFIGKSLSEVRGVIRAQWASGYHMSSQGLQFGVLGAFDTASWDLLAKDACRPLSDLIGGRLRDRVMAYASTGYITEDNDSAFFRRCVEEAAQQGFKAIKIKIGLGAASDEERVRVVREVMGTDALILVDVNGNYTVEQALASIKRMEPYGIHWLEEPLSPEDQAGYARLRQLSGMTIAAGEALYSRFAMRDLIQARLVDVVQPDINKIGGVSEMAVVRDMAETNNVRFSPHAWAGAVALNATLQVLATVSPYPSNRNEATPLLLEFDRGNNPIRDELLIEPIRLDSEGFVPIPNRPGLGVQVDPQALTRLSGVSEIPEVIG
ncbi:MAG: mandelate racemase/muconate lactonizing enzyme family protein [Trueperaceae bacterium]